MAKKMTFDDWDNIQKKAPARYYVQSEEDGKVRIVLDTEVVAVEKGDEDLVGNVWDKDWTKVEAKVLINGEPKVYSFGGVEWSFLRNFIGVCKKHGIKPEDMPGHVFDITKTGDWDYEIEYVGTDDGSGNTEPELSDDEYSDIVSAISDIKASSPELIKAPEKKGDFLKILMIKSRVKPSTTEKYLDRLCDEKIIEIDDNKVKVL